MTSARTSRSLRRRVFLIGTATLVALLMITYLFTAAITVSSLSRLERRMACEDAEELRGEIARATNVLSQRMSAWLVEQEAALPRYCADLRAGAATATSLPADVVAAFSGSGEFLGGSVNPVRARGPSDNILAELRHLKAAVVDRSPDSALRRAGVLPLKMGLLCVSLQQAKLSGGQSINLLFGEWLHVGRRNLAIGNTQQWKTLLANVVDEGSRRPSSREEALVVQEVSDRELAVSFALRNPFDAPPAMATLAMPREIHACMQQCLDFLMWAMVMVGLLGGFLVRNLLVKLIFSRLQKLNAGVSRIGATGDWSLRLAPDGKDDLAELAESINGLAGRLAAAQTDLRDSHQRADMANEAKSRFLANMSHEIRTPLNGILGFAKLLDTGGETVSAEERREWTHTICTCSEHLLALINDVLDFSKIEAGRLDLERIRCPIASLLTETVGVMRPQADAKKLQLQVSGLEVLPPTIITDPTRLRQVITNLLSNAIKFTEKGSIELACEREEGWLNVHIRDTGCGIPLEQLHAIFDPFVQADNSVTRKFGGTGLGLAISRQIARGLSGDLTVSSVPGQGSTFTLRLPVVVDKSGVRPSAAGAKRALPAPAEEAAPSRMAGRVLLVEDGETNRKLIELVLRRAGLAVDLAENGRVGVEKAGRTQYDLILMDMQMPVMDGYAATQTLRRQGVTIPIIALTAHALGGDQARCTSAGCSGYLSKPVDPDLLLKTIRAALAPTAQPMPSADACAIAAREKQNPVDLGGPEKAVATALRKDAIACSLPVDDPEFREVALEFVDRLQEKLASMEAALSAQDLGELGRLAHWLKGAGGTVGFHCFTGPAAELETSARESQTRRVRELLESIQDIAGRIEIPKMECASGTT